MYRTPRENRARKNVQIRKIISAQGQRTNLQLYKAVSTPVAGSQPLMNTNMTLVKSDSSGSPNRRRLGGPASPISNYM